MQPQRWQVFFLTDKRTTSIIRSVLLLIALVFLAPLCTAFRGKEYSLILHKKQLVACAGQGPYFLSPFIIPNSEKIVIKNDTLSRYDYEINYTKGIIYFKERIAEGDTILCIYEKIPWPIKSAYLHRRVPNKNVVIKKNSLLNSNRVAKQIDNLIVSGEKTLGISFGSKEDLSFNQSTQIGIGGMISKNIRIEGILKDDIISMGADGTSEELGDLDGMSIKIEGKNLKAVFGDFDLSFNAGELGNISRKVEGVQGEIKGIKLGGGILKGKFTTKRFIGKTGNQGPYKLMEKGTIVAGSEKVYINGKKVKRNKDYIIDYGACEIRFTSNCVIQDDDKLRIDFEYRDDSYRREAYFASCKINIGSVSITPFIFKEEDNKANPLSFALTKDRLKVFREAKSNAGKIWISGASFVGEGNGNYIKKCSTQDTIYEYVGHGKGNYLVRFTNVGEGKGDYEFDNGLGGMRYVGQNAGNYIPKIMVTLPEDRTFFEIKAEKKLSAIRILGELGLTKVNLNTFSNNQKLGSAFSASLELNKKLYSFSCSYQDMSENFYFPGSRGIGDTLTSKRVKLLGTIAPASFLGINFGYIKVPNILERNEANISLTPTKLPHLSYQFTKISTLTSLERKDIITVLYKLKNATPFLSYNVEKWLGKQKKSTAIGIKMKCMTLQLSHAETDTLKGNWKCTKKANIAKLTLSLHNKSTLKGANPIPINTDFNLNLFHREDNTNIDKRSLDIGNLSLKTYFSKNCLTIDYNLNSIGNTVYREEYYEVEPGKGSFKRDTITGEYYKDTEGNYNRRLVPCDSSEIMKEYYFNHNLYLYPTPFVDLRIKVSKRGIADRVTFWGKNQDALMDKNTICLRGSLFKNYGADLRIEDFRENRIRENHSFGTTSNLTFFSCLDPVPAAPINLKFRLIRNLRGSREKGIEWQESVRSINLESKYIIKKPITLQMELEQAHREIIEPPHLLNKVRLNSIAISPKIMYNLRDKIFNTKLKLIHNRIDRKEHIPANIRALYPMGLTTECEISVSFQPKGKTAYSLSYSAEKRPGKPINHKGNIEAKVSF